MDELKLRNCPFCGKSVAKIFIVSEINGDYDNEWANTHYVVVCDYEQGGCGSCGACRNDTPEEASEAWNRRVDEC